MRGRWLAIGGALMVAAAVGCAGDSTGSGQWSDPTKITYYDGLHVNLSRMSRTTSGVFYWDSIAGTGTYQARPGDQLTVDYKLWTPDGTLKDQQQGYPVTLSSTNLIQGWVDGLTGVVQGSARQLVIPPALAYGSTGNGSIPPDATLVFLITVDRITPAVPGDVVAVQRLSDALVASGAASRFH